MDRPGTRPPFRRGGDEDILAAEQIPAVETRTVTLKE